MDQDYSKKDLKKLKRLQELELKNQQASQNTVKWVAIAVVAVIFVAFFGFIIFSVKQNKQQVATTKISRNGWVRGNAKASTTLVEYGDLQCPACKAYEPLVEQVMKDFNGKIKLIFKHFPLTQAHKNAMAAAQFAEAAGKQGKFWEVHDLLYKNQDEWGEQDDPQPFFDKYSKIFNLNIDKLHADEKSPAVMQKIQENQDDGIAAGVDATPTFFLNNNMLTNPSSYNDLKATIQKVIKNQ